MKRRWELPAKLNWGLRVLGRRADGFHELRSWFVALDLCDILSVSLAGDPERSDLAVQAPPAIGSVPTGADNLLLAAERAWRAAGGRAPTLHWELEKRIPTGAGLGGGSADAGGALCALEEFATRPLGLRSGGEVAAAIGSDVSFFFVGNGAEWRGGRGEALLARAPAPGLWVVLAVPPFPVSTPRVYAALASREWDGADPEAESAPPPEPGPNDLEEAAYEAYPELESFARALRKAADFRMSGSGGCHFSTVGDRAAGEALAARIAPRCHSSFVTRIRSGRVVAEVAPCP